MTERPWLSVSSNPPPNGEKVETKIDDGVTVRNIQPLRREGRLWFTDGMYVYYTPTHWRELAKWMGEKRR